MLKSEWDDAKAQANLTKRGASFEEAASVFGDPLALTFPDPDHSIVEKCWLSFGISYSGRVRVVAHAERGQSIRIISARRATRHERGIYEHG